MEKRLHREYNKSKLKGNDNKKNYIEGVYLCEGERKHTIYIRKLLNKKGNIEKRDYKKNKLHGA